MPISSHENMVNHLEGFDETMKRLLDLAKGEGRGWFIQFDDVLRQSSLLGIFANRHRVDLKALFAYPDDEFMAFFEGLREDYILMAFPNLTADQQKVAKLFDNKMPVFKGKYIPKCADTRATIKIN